MFVSFIRSLLLRDCVTIFSTSIFLAQKTLSMPHLKTFSRTFSFREDNRLQRSKLACLHSCNLETAAIIAIIIALAIIATFAVTFIVIIGRMAIKSNKNSKCYFVSTLRGLVRIKYSIKEVFFFFKVRQLLQCTMYIRSVPQNSVVGANSLFSRKQYIFS